MNDRNALACSQCPLAIGEDEVPTIIQPLWVNDGRTTFVTPSYICKFCSRHERLSIPLDGAVIEPKDDWAARIPERLEILDRYVQCDRCHESLDRSTDTHIIIFIVGSDRFEHGDIDYDNWVRIFVVDGEVVSEAEWRTRWTPRAGDDPKGESMGTANGL